MNSPLMTMLLLAALSADVAAQRAGDPRATDQRQTGYWGDQGDGTYRNPVVAGDYSDPDVIRVGDDFYMISSTINMSPGMVVLHSRDLVNWRTVSHVVSDLSTLGPELNWDRMNRYGEGIYAGSIRHRNGLFYVHFTSYLEGFFVATAKNAAGPWTVQPMKDGSGRALLVPKWDDPCPLWDDDGKAYLVASKPGGAWFPHLFRMSDDGMTLLDADAAVMSKPGAHPSGQGTIIYNKDSAEGNKLYKRNGLYYFYNNEVAWRGRMAIMRRSRFIYGELADGSAGTAARPGAYQTKPMLATSAANRELNQGGLVDTPDGRWYFLTQGGAGGHADGRVINLLPVVWLDGWPFPGQDDDHDMLGDVVWSAPMPIRGQELRYPQGSDDFSAAELDPRWEWNHQPRFAKWSLRERPGWMRLHAFRPLATGQFFTAGNTLAQRYLSAAAVAGTFKLDVSALVAGQKAGLVHFNGGKHFAAVQIVKEKQVLRLQYEENGVVAMGPALSANTRLLWLRTSVNYGEPATFSFSTDGHRYTPLDFRYTPKWGGYRGDYIGVFTYNDREDRGYIDVDSFVYEVRARP